VHTSHVHAPCSGHGSPKCRRIDGDTEKLTRENAGHENAVHRDGTSSAYTF